MPDIIEPEGITYRLLKNARKIFILSLLIGGFGWIGINALFLQTGHHPAPLFVPPVTPSEQALIDAPPQPTPRPLTKTTDNEHVESSKPPVKLSAPQPVTTPPKTTPKDEIISASKDPIAQLLTAQQEPSEARIKASQRALIKLGYVLRDNGIFGPTTEQAVEIYQKRNNLTITGTLSDELIHDLTVKSGINIP